MDKDKSTWEKLKALKESETLEQVLAGEDEDITLVSHLNKLLFAGFVFWRFDGYEDVILCKMIITWKTLEGVDMGKEKSTLEKLVEVKESETLEQVLSGEDEDITLVSHLNKLLFKCKLDTSAFAEKLIANRAFIYQIQNGLRRPSRDMLLKMAFVLSLTLDETQRLLTIGDRGILYPRLRRDRIIIFALEKQYTLTQADMALTSEGEQPLLVKT